MTPDVAINATNFNLEQANRDVKFWKRVALVLAVALIGAVIIALCVDKRYTLGKAIVNAGICVEYDVGYECETKDN